GGGSGGRGAGVGRGGGGGRGAGDEVQERHGGADLPRAGAARRGCPRTPPGAGGRLGTLGRGALSGWVGPAESRAVTGAYGTDGQAGPAALVALQVHRRVPAGAAAARRDQDASSTDDPDDGADAGGSAGGQGDG